jgi:hypothetical protein
MPDTAARGAVLRNAMWAAVTGDQFLIELGGSCWTAPASSRTRWAADVPRRRGSRSWPRRRAGPSLAGRRVTVVTLKG